MWRAPELMTDAQALAQANVAAGLVAAEPAVRPTEDLRSTVPVRAAAFPLPTPALSWLHREATVQDVHVLPDAGVADVTVIISNAAFGKFRKLFPE